MLAAQHRLTASEDFSTVTRHGARAGTATVVVAARVEDYAESALGQNAQPWRCGLIVSKAVGNAVRRHRTARRLRHIVRDLIDSGEVSLPAQGRADFVVRALSASVQADHAALAADVRSGLRRALAKAGRKGARATG